MSQAELKINKLKNGDKLTQDEFLRIWEESPDIKFAELIEGIVRMASPVGDEHASSILWISGWITAYLWETPGVAGGASGTWKMSDSVPQPDAVLRILPEFGGHSRIEGKYPTGAPELVVEAASSSVSYDLHEKLKLYLETGVQEYLVVVLPTSEIFWHKRVDGNYERLEPDAKGVFRSQVFPGLWLNASALLDYDSKEMQTTLQEGLRSPEHLEFVAQLQRKATS
jgi:hypothetical protein